MREITLAATLFAVALSLNAYTFEPTVRLEVVTATLKE
jgi:hypothetical protein